MSVRRSISKIVIGIILLSFFAEPGFARPPITRVKNIKELSPEKADRALPVQITGQVRWVNPHKNSLFLYDEESGISVKGPVGDPTIRTLRGGEIIRVNGTTDPGGFSPEVHAEKIFITGRKPIPPARSLFPLEYHSPLIDGDWAQIKGHLTTMTTQRGLQTITLKINRNNVVLNVLMPYSEHNEKRLAELMFKYVHFPAVCSTIFNKNRQAIGRLFLANSSDDFTVAQINVLSESPTELPIHKLYQHGIAGPRRKIQTQGIVTYVNSHELYLRGDLASLKVTTPLITNVQIGDEVQVCGIVWPQPVSPAFRACSIEKIKKASLPAPVRVELENQIDASCNYDLIDMDAELIEVGKQFSGADGVSQQTLLCRASGHLFEAVFPPGTVLGKHLKPQAKVRLVGICSVIRNRNISRYLHVDGFSLKLRSIDDITVLAKAPWWTSQRLVWLLSILLTTMTLFIVWVSLLQRTVENQTDIIRDNVKRASVMNERQRIARELHDNLIQGLVAMEVRLSGCIRKMELNRNKIRNRLEKTAGPTILLQPAIEELTQCSAEEREALNDLWHMMGRCSEESRSSILYLRSGLAGRISLCSTLQEVLEPMADESGISLQIKQEGPVQVFTQEIERNLMLTTKEAVTNAIQHSGTDRMEVTLCYSEETLQIEIQDFGCGFDTRKIQKKDHFGLAGMKERIKQLGGSVQITSAAGDGTKVIISLNLTTEREV